MPVPPERLPLELLGRVHFVGIGGAGLSGIAKIMLARGVPVSGSDAADSRVIAALRSLGATCWVGHDAEHVRDVDTVVVSTAVRATNPEVIEAQRLGRLLLPRSAALDSVMHGRKVVAIAGTHGKTTTTSLLAVALQHCGVDPSYAIGGDLDEPGSNAHDGSGELFVAEADESDGAFLVYSPFGAVVTNVEADHLDNYGTTGAYEAAFERFVERIDPHGFLVTCVDDRGAAHLADVGRARALDVIGFGAGPDADLRAESVEFVGTTSRFTLVRQGIRLGDVSLRIPGRHYVLDALGALGAGLELGFPFADLRDGLEQFAGTRRRMELMGAAGGVRVYDSYAHHPTEIRGDLLAARSIAGDGRVVVCFQPHMVSRTRIFATDMAQALALADEVVVMDIYVAREEPEPGVDGELVASQVPLPEGRVTAESSWDKIPQLLADKAGPGDVVITLGAGDVTLLAPEVLAALNRTGVHGG